MLLRQVPAQDVVKNSKMGHVNDVPSTHLVQIGSMEIFLCKTNYNSTIIGEKEMDTVK